MKQSVWIGLLQQQKFFLKRKVVNKNLCSDFSTVNTDRPIISHSRNSNNKRNKEKSFFSINECSNAFDSVKVHKLKNPKNIIIGHLNVNSSRNKVIAVEEVMRDKVDICLFSETKLDETFSNQQFKFMPIRCIAGIETNMPVEFFVILMKIFHVK